MEQKLLWVDSNYSIRDNWRIWYWVPEKLLLNKFPLKIGVHSCYFTLNTPGVTFIVVTGLSTPELSHSKTEGNSELTNHRPTETAFEDKRDSQLQSHKFNHIVPSFNFFDVHQRTKLTNWSFIAVDRAFSFNEIVQGWILWQW